MPHGDAPPWPNISGRVTGGGLVPESGCVFARTICIVEEVVEAK